VGVGTRSDTRGRSVSDHNSKNRESRKSEQKSHEINTGVSTTKNVKIDRDFMESISSTISSEIRQPIPLGVCMYRACVPKVTSMAVPFLCKTDYNGIIFRNAEIQNYTLKADNGLECVHRMLPCDKDIPSFTELDDDYDDTNTIDNSIRQGNITTAESGRVIRSKDNVWALEFENESNLVVKRDNEVKWSTGLVNFGMPNPVDERQMMRTRYRITNTGHFVQEAINIFDPSYNDDKWTVVWSSVPYHMMDSQVGTSEGRGYVMTLKNNGELALRDGSGVLIWTTAYYCKHRLGYKYPIMTKVPTIYISEKNHADQTDVHNVAPDIVKKIAYIDKMISKDVKDKKCGPVYGSDVGLVSSTGRFMLYLSDTGNLIFKDDQRTMWSSMTANLDFVPDSAKYHMFLDNLGNLHVRDNRNRIIFSTYTDVKGVAPFSGVVTNIGTFDIIDANGILVWTSELNDGGKNGEAIWYDSSQTVCIDIVDGCQECEVFTDFKPLINLSTNKCVGLNGVSDCDPDDDKQLWSFDDINSQYRNKHDYERCLGDATGKSVSKRCTTYNTWEHTPDGLMTMIENNFHCLNPDGFTKLCANPKVQMYWSHGRRKKDKVTKNLLLVTFNKEKESMVEASMDEYGNFIFKDENGSEVHRIDNSIDRKGSYRLEVFDKELKIIDNEDNLEIGAFAIKDGGRPPYHLTTVAKKNNVMILKDANGEPVWSSNKKIKLLESDNRYKAPKNIRILKSGDVIMSDNHQRDDPIRIRIDDHAGFVFEDKKGREVKRTDNGIKRKGNYHLKVSDSGELSIINDDNGMRVRSFKVKPGGELPYHLMVSANGMGSLLLMDANDEPIWNSNKEQNYTVR
jgi:hypothetical protein